MTIQVYPYNKNEEEALLEFLESRHYKYQSTEEHDGITDAEFFDAYNNDLDEAEAEIEAGDYISHEDVTRFFLDKKKKRASES